MHRGQREPAKGVPARIPLRLRLAGRVIAFAWLIAWCVATPRPAPATFDLTPHEILASGDIAECFGAIGVAGFDIDGLDGSGRLLVRAMLSNGDQGLFWADASGVTALWRSGDPTTRLVAAATNAQGRVMALDAPRRTVYDVSAGTLRPLLRAGDTAPDGDTVCAIHDVALNDDGAVAVLAYSGASTCDGEAAAQNLYVIAGGSARTVVRFPTLDPPDLELIGIAADGTVVYTYDDGGPIFAVRDGVTRTLADRGSIASHSDAPLLYADAVAISSTGEVVFGAADADFNLGIYRTRGTEIVRVAVAGDALPTGYPLIDASDDAVIDAAGNVAFSGDWNELDDASGPAVHQVHGVLFYPAGGAPRVVSHAGAPRAINDAGAVALLDGYGPSAAARWSDGRLVRVLAAGDPAPGGGAFAVRGLEGVKCLGADGRVVTGALAAESEALLCGDASGFKQVARRGDPAPGGGTFATFSQCGVPDGGEVLFAAARPLSGNAYFTEEGVYRATPRGIERVAVPGMVAPDGTAITALEPVSPGTFAFNERGTVLVRARSERGATFFLRQRRGEALEGVRLSAYDVEVDAGRVNEAALAGDDTVIAIAFVRGGYEAVIAAGGARAGILVDSADPRLSGPSPHNFRNLRASGERTTFLSCDATSQGCMQLVVEPDGAVAPLLSEHPDWLPTVFDFTPAGRALYQGFDPSGTWGLFLLDETVVPLAGPQLPGELQPLALNDRGNLLWLTLDDGLDASIHRLALSGPVTDSTDCFIPPTPVFEPLPTQTPTPSPLRCDGEDSAVCVRLETGSAAGRPGERVTVGVRLHVGAYEVAGTQNDLTLAAEAGSFVATDSGRPACRVNPAIDKTATASVFRPSADSVVRVLVLAYDNVDPIPDGALLYECDVQIAADATPGIYALAASNAGAADPPGNALPTHTSDGAIEVLGKDAASGGPAHAASRAGGCQLGQPPHTSAWPLLIAAMLALLTRGRRHRGRGAPSARRTRRSSATGVSILIGTLALFTVASAHATVPDSREILATGDVAAGFGRIGIDGFRVFGIDADGRLLVGGPLHTGGSALLWASDAGLMRLWSGPSDSEVARALLSGRVRVSGSGRVVATDSASLFRVNARGVRVLRAGDALADGLRLCGVRQLAINDAGTVAFNAVAAADRAGCNAPQLALYLWKGGATQRLADATSLGAPYWDLTGIAADDSVRVLTSDRRILAANGEAVSVLVDNGDLGPSGEPLHVIDAWGVSPAGEVAFRASSADPADQDDGPFAVYRTDSGMIRRVDRPIAGLTRFDPSSSLRMNGDGTVALDASWLEDTSPTGGGLIATEGVILFPSAGDGRVVARDAVLRGINESGAVGLIWTADPPASAARWRNGVIRPLLTALDEVPGGGSFIIGGILSQGAGGPSCLAADGRVGADVVSPAYRWGLACGDARGFHAVVQEGDAAPEGGTFHTFDQCGFPDRAEMLFTAGLVPYSVGLGVYRATPAHLERAIGAGQLTDRGTALRRVVPVGSNRRSFFAFNAAGTVLGRAETDRVDILVRRRRGGPLEEIALDLGLASVAELLTAGLTDDDRIVAAVILSDGNQALALSDGSDTRLLSVEPAGVSLTEPFVRGSHVALIATDTATSLELRLLDLANETTRLLWSDPLSEPWWIRDATPGARILIEIEPRAPEFQTRNVLVDESGAHPLPEGPEFVRPLRLNDRGNVLIYSWQTPDGIPRETLTLDGPPTSSTDCFIAPTLPLQPSPTPTLIPPDCAGRGDDNRCLMLELGTASGRPGDRVTVDVRLHTGGHQIAAIQNDLLFVTDAPFAAGADGRPACRTNPTIDKNSTASAFLPAGCQPGVDCERLRVIVLAYDNTDPIPDGSTLCTCELQIAAGARPGHYAIVGSNVGFSDPDGTALVGDVRNGAVEVLASGSASQAAAVAAGHGCQIGAPAPTSGWALVVLTALATLVRGRRRSPRRRAARRTDAEVRRHGSAPWVGRVLLALLLSAGGGIGSKAQATRRQISTSSSAGGAADAGSVQLGEQDLAREVWAAEDPLVEGPALASAL